MGHTSDSAWDYSAFSVPPPPEVNILADTGTSPDSGKFAEWLTGSLSTAVQPVPSANPAQSTSSIEVHSSATSSPLPPPPPMQAGTQHSPPEVATATPNPSAHTARGRRRGTHLHSPQFPQRGGVTWSGHHFMLQRHAPVPQNTAHEALHTTPRDWPWAGRPYGGMPCRGGRCCAATAAAGDTPDPEEPGPAPPSPPPPSPWSKPAEYSFFTEVDWPPGWSDRLDRSVECVCGGGGGSGTRAR